MFALDENARVSFSVIKTAQNTILNIVLAILNTIEFSDSPITVFFYSYIDDHLFLRKETYSCREIYVKYLYIKYFNYKNLTVRIFMNKM